MQAFCITDLHPLNLPCRWWQSVINRLILSLFRLLFGLGIGLGRLPRLALVAFPPHANDYSIMLSKNEKDRFDLLVARSLDFHGTYIRWTHTGKLQKVLVPRASRLVQYRIHPSWLGVVWCIMMHSIDTTKYKRRLKVDSLEKREGLSLMWLVNLA